MAITRVRRVQTNEVVLDQADFFQSGGFDRVSGLTTVSITAKLFWDNQVQPCVLVDGANVTNVLVAAGSVYWHEIPSASGYYSVRWRPAGTGFWRLVLSYAAGTQVQLFDYDVVSETTAISANGLKASFSKP